MRVVYKYPFAIDDTVVIEMPEGAQVVKVDQQAGVPTLWALVDPARPSSPHREVVRGTGHWVPDHVEHLWSVVRWAVRLAPLHK